MGNFALLPETPMDYLAGGIALIRHNLLEQSLMIRLPHTRAITGDAYKIYHQFWKVVTDDFGDLVVVEGPY